MIPQRRPTLLEDRLRLMILTSPAPACGRALIDVVADCLVAGADAIQLRDKQADARALARQAAELLTLTRAAGALLVVNDRLDVALATGADGVHLGPDDLPVSAARAIAPHDLLIGYSTDDPHRAARAEREGASYLGVGAVYGTRSKPGLADESIGLAGVEAVRGSCGLPCLGIGGIDPKNAAAVFATGAGVAVLGAVMDAPDPAAVVRRLSSLARPDTP